MDRPALAARVFGNPKELAALNAILHPRLRRRMEAAIASARRDPRVPAVVMDAAVMLEAGWDDLCTHLVFVDAPAKARAERSASRGWSAAEWQARENSQIPLDAKRQHCYLTLDNSSSPSRLRQRVCQLFEAIIHSANRSR